MHVTAEFLAQVMVSLRNLHTYATVNSDHLENANGTQTLCNVVTYRGLCIGEGRFRILGGEGARFRIWGGGQGKTNFQQAHDVVRTSMRRKDIASTSFRRHVPTRFLRNQCQIITFLILKSDFIENSRIELRGIVLPAPSNQITFIIILPFNLVH